MAEFTPEQSFIVKRLRNKVVAAKHQLSDAVLAARATSPEVLAQAGLVEAVDMLKRCLSELEWVVHGHPAPAAGAEVPHG